MGLVFLDGFDDRATVDRKWSNASASQTPDISALPSDNVRGTLGSVWRCTNLTGSTWHTDPASQSTYVCGFALHKPQLTFADWTRIFSFLDSSVVNTIQIDYSETRGKFRVSNTNFTSAESIRVNLNTGWFYLEFKVTIGPAGPWELRLNGRTPALLSGTDNTDGSGGGDIGGIQLVGFRGRVDDLYLADTNTPYPSGGSGADNDDFLGPLRVHTRYMVGDSSQHLDWTPTPSGDHHATQDEGELGSNGDPRGDFNNDGSSSMVESSTSTNKELFQSGDLPSGVGTVLGVQVGSYVYQPSGAETIRHLIGSGFDSSVSNSEFTHSVSGSQYICEYGIWDRDPDPAVGTPKAWDVTGVNAREYGTEVV